MYAAFDPGFPQERLDVCSEKDAYGNVEPIHAWRYEHGRKFAEIWKNTLAGKIIGFTPWDKQKIIPVEVR